MFSFPAVMRLAPFRDVPGEVRIVARCVRFADADVDIMEFVHGALVFIRRYAPNEDWWARRESNPHALSGNGF